MRVQGVQYESLIPYKGYAFYPKEICFILEYILIFLYKSIILQSPDPASNNNTLKKEIRKKKKRKKSGVLRKNLFLHDAPCMEKTAENSVKLVLRVIINYS